MKEFEQIAVKIKSKEDYKKSKKLFQKLGYKNDKKWNELYVDKIGGVIKYNLGFESGMFSLQSSCVNFKTFKSIKEFKEYVKSKEPKKYYMIKPAGGNKYQKTCAYVCVKSTDTNFSKGVNHKGKTTKIYNTPAAIDKGIEITKEEFLNEYNKAKQLKRKKGKLTIIVSKNYKELYEDNLALVNHILLDTVRGDFEWVEKVQKSNLNITLYTDKNDPELFKKSFGKFEVKLMDKEECKNNLKGLVLVSRKGVDKSRLQEPEYVKQMIKEGKILHAENFNKSLLMDNGSTISNVKEGEVKSIEELHVEHRDNNSIGKSYSKEDLFLSAEIFNPKGLCVKWMEEFNKIPGHVFDALKFRTPQGQSMLKVDSNQVNTTFNPQSHYNNEFGSLYKMSEKLGLNTYEFDILKRVVRCRKKGQFEEDLQKTKDLIDLYLIESKK